MISKFFIDKKYKLMLMVMFISLMIIPNYVFSATSIITKQPETVTVKENESITFEVEATGENLNYKWLYKKSNDEFTWVEVPEKIASGITTNKLSIKNALTQYQGYSFRCLVDSELSNVAYLYVIDEIKTEVIKENIEQNKNIIKKQPETVSVKENDEVIFEVNASGDNLSYTWLYRKSNEEYTWIEVAENIADGVNSNTLRIKNTSIEYQGYSFRCLVEGEETEFSSVAFLYVQNDNLTEDIVKTESLIEKQPETITALENTEAVFKVETLGENLTYKWLYKKADNDFTWTKVPDEIATGITTNILTIKNTSIDYQGYAFRCLVEGNVAELSNIAYLYINNNELNEDVIISQIKSPENFVASGDINKNMTLTFVNPNLENNIVLEALNSNDEWIVISNNAISPFIITGLEENTSYEYRICAKDINNIKSEYLYATGYIPYLLEKSIITKHPETIIIKENEKATFKVEAIGENLTYKWLYRKPTEEFTWAEVTNEMATGIDTNTLIIENALTQYQGYSFRCLVEGEEIEFSNEAYLYIQDNDLNEDILIGEIIITKHPETIMVKENEKVTFKVETIGENLTYKWLYRKPTEEFTWTEVTNEMAIGIETNTLTIENTSMNYHGYAFRCLVEGVVSELSDVAYLWVGKSEQDIDVVVKSITYYYEDGKEYDSNWTNQNVIAVLPITNKNTKGVVIKIGSGDWTNDFDDIQIEKVNEYELNVIFNNSIDDTVYIRRIDNEGNIITDDLEGKIIKIDKEKPIIQDLSYKTINKTLVLNAKLIDNVSGIESYSLTLEEKDELNWAPVTDKFIENKIEIKVDGSGTYYLCVKDKVGNISDLEVVKAIKDINPPTGEITVKEKYLKEDNVEYTKNNLITLIITANDDFTKPENLQMAIYREEEYKNLKNVDEIIWENYSHEKEWTLEKENADEKVYLILKDEAGNISIRLEN